MGKRQKYASRYVRIPIPIEKNLNDRLQIFWKSIFGESPDLEPAVFLGKETKHNTSILYLIEEDKKPISTTVVTNCKILPELGGFGEVATEPSARGKGLATRLCNQSLEDFKDNGGEALFLGTVNPDAAKIYHRLGWRKLSSTIVWTNVTDKRPPEQYLLDYFREPTKTVVEEGNPGVRIPMIPLIITPHDWQVLDSNTGIYSSRYSIIRSCMGLYPKYQATRSGGHGNWFSARDTQKRVVGLSSAIIDKSGVCKVDGFSHHAFGYAWEQLLLSAIGWAKTREIEQIVCNSPVVDEERIRKLSSIGFKKTGIMSVLNMDGQELITERMEL